MPLPSPAIAVAAQLSALGPDARDRTTCDRAEAEAYCRGLAESHYENFTVASWLLPTALRQPMCNVYAYCRWADDLADEVGDPARSLELLDWWERELLASYEGRAWHPVFVALRATNEEFAIPPEPYLDLLRAFRQDQRRTSYATFDELLGYCRNSANPVGRLVLHLGRCASAENIALSDSICTGLQLANFWQDVARDLDSGRVYLPEETLARFRYSRERLYQRTADDEFRQMLAFEVDRAAERLRAGSPLVERVPGELQIDVGLFVAGGEAILQAIRAADYDVWTRRPTVSKLAQTGLLARAAWNRFWSWLWPRGGPA